MKLPACDVEMPKIWIFLVPALSLLTIQGGVAVDQEDATSPVSPAGAENRRTDVDAWIKTIGGVLKIGYLNNSETKPYTYDVTAKPGHPRGMLVDVFREMQAEFNFAVKWLHITDNKYGMPGGKTTNATGAFLDLQQEKIHIGSIPMILHSNRKANAHFVHSFHSSGLAVLVRPQLAKSNLARRIVHTALRPFSAAVWAIIVCATLAVGMMLWGMNMFNPYEWGPRYASGLSTAAEASSFNLTGALWYSFTLLQWQGYERAPRSGSARMLSCFWMGFVTMCLITYTAGMLNQLFWESSIVGKNVRKGPIYDLNSLISHHNGISLGVVKDGNVHRFIKKSGDTNMKKLIEFWKTTEGSNYLYTSMEKALADVADDSKMVGLIGETYYLKYIVNHPKAYFGDKHEHQCNYQVVENLFKLNSFFAMPMSLNTPSTVIHAFDVFILQLIESGRMAAIEQSWWVDKSECWISRKIEETATSLSAMALDDIHVISVSEFHGPFFTILFGAILSALYWALEIVYYRHKGRYDESNRPCGATLKLDEE